MPINLAIAAAWKLASEPSNAIPVYNATSSTVNPISWGQVQAKIEASILKFPMENALWYPGLSLKEYKWVNKICQVK
jgi:hypothetical protein